MLIIAGADDVITPAEGPQKLFAVLRSRSRVASVSEELHIVGDAGHAVYLEHPAAVAGAAAAFFRSMA